MHKCTTQIRGQGRMFATDKPRAMQKGEGFISGKLPMTEDEGRIQLFVEYTVVAVAHVGDSYILWGRHTRM